MKCIFVLSVLALISLVTADTQAHSRGCIYILGKCAGECPVGTHAYALGCGYLLPEATCEQPHPVHQDSIMCDYSSCYCDPPTVRDTTTNKCVPLEQCPHKKVQ